MVVPTSTGSFTLFLLVVALAAQALAEGKTQKELYAEAVDVQRQGPPPSECTYGFISIPGSTKSYYFIREIIGLNWTTAKQMCEDEQLQLAEPEDPSPIVKWTNENCGNRYSSIWLGARGDGSSLIWQHRGQAIDYSSPYWWGSHDNKTSEDYCLMLNPTTAMIFLNLTYSSWPCSSDNLHYGAALCEVPDTTPKNCVDNSSNCPKWAAQGKCNKGKIYWKCKSSCACGTCSPLCNDTSSKCPKWADEGKCNEEKVFNKCKTSCACGDIA